MILTKQQIFSASTRLVQWAVCDEQGNPLFEAGDS
jgi:hypothetical protein